MVTWTHKRRRRLLMLANAALAAGIALCAWGALLLPLGSSAGPGRSAPGTAPAASRAEQGAGPLSAYAVTYGRPLRKPLYDPKLKKIIAVKKPEPKLTVKLAGTVTEPGFTYAFFRTRGGEEKLVAIGQRIEGAKVLAIGDGSATVEFHGKRITLRKAKGGTR